ncbi:response regulator transcription factor [Chitinophaga niabensis]|uniref:DNA-binding response regulator, OmpR family, contains REC and winged-helix (WHTH) domain n=1 Tax=Chitinophaga niabensis TaxID=536979 RepID=A0A1N6E230_9BACT|nr:response regulator transcription factor [Chitinophaga niabensis]SIN77044.1 DNA-binding response regulator, OmpR family, contains REC and winged-helix (wHTH) domain [Chitinophaga niabensis]
MKILIIEDEVELAKSMGSYLSDESYLCEYASTYAQALERIDSFDYDCILLDLMLPGGDGFQILKELKLQKKNDGVIIISAKNSMDDKINGLRIGADDYLAKPFHLPELAARVYSLIRRKHFGSVNVIEQQEIRVDVLGKAVTIGGKPMLLTKKEFDLLMYFMINKNRVISKAALAEHLSGDVAAQFDSYDFVYSHIKNLKRKLNEAGVGQYLKTMYGSGYKWEI